MATLSPKSTVPSQLRALGRLAAHIEAHPFQHPIEAMAEFFRLKPLERQILADAYNDSGDDPIDAISR